VGILVGGTNADRCSGVVTTHYTQILPKHCMLHMCAGNEFYRSRGYN